MNIDDTLDARDKTHGSLLARGELVQDLKDRMRQSDNWRRLSGGQRETLDMIQHKISRILQGDPDYLDHWDDLAGYPMQCAREIRRRRQAAEQAYNKSGGGVTLDAIASGRLDPFGNSI